MIEQRREYRPRKYVFEIGSIHPTMHWGDVEIIDNTNSNKLRVKFLNTGNTQTCRSADLAVGKVRDDKLYKKQGAASTYPNPSKDASFIPSGTIFSTNFYGDVIVEEYITGKKIIVKFLNTGNTREVQKDALKKGLVQDIKERTRLSREKKKANALEKKKAKELAKKEAKKKADEKDAARKAQVLQNKVERQKRKEEKIQLENQQKLLVIGEKHFDKLGMEFSIIARDVITDFCTVQYVLTGNEYDFTYRNITGGQYDVYDRESPNFEGAFAKYSKERSVQYYEKNRDMLMSKALQYQKDNPDKANHYNRVRRGKRKGVEGTHTKAQTDQLLIEQDNKCACCDVSFDLVPKHLDHKHPIALGGTNWIENLQWLCAFCNLVKNDSHPDVWEEYSQSQEFKERRNQRLLTV